MNVSLIVGFSGRLRRAGSFDSPEVSGGARVGVKVGGGGGDAGTGSDIWNLACKIQVHLQVSMGWMLGLEVRWRHCSLLCYTHITH